MRIQEPGIRAAEMSTYLAKMAEGWWESEFGSYHTKTHVPKLSKFGKPAEEEADSEDDDEEVDEDLETEEEALKGRRGTSSAPYVCTSKGHKCLGGMKSKKLDAISRWLGRKRQKQS